MKRLLGVFCAVCMMLATEPAAFAVDEPLDMPMEPTGTVAFDQIVDLNARTSTPELLLPHNGGSGTSGASICFFTADTEHFSIAMRLTPGSGGTGTDYHIQLWRIHADGSETKVGNAVAYDFNSGPYWKNELTIGNDYYVKVSSTTVGTNGAECQYIWSTEEHASFT